MSEKMQAHITKLSDQELEKYVIDHKRYMIEAVEIAVAELRRRGNNISDSELIAMREAIRQREEERKAKSEKNSGFSDWKKNVVDDPNAPELYSERAIWGFAAAMMPLFGSILFSMNLYRLKKNAFILPVIIFGVAWLALVSTLLPERPATFPIFIVNAFGGLVFQYFFWPKFVGKEFKYRRRPIWIPLAIAIIITGIFIWGALSDNGN